MTLSTVRNEPAGNETVLATIRGRTRCGKARKERTEVQLTGTGGQAGRVEQGAKHEVADGRAEADGHQELQLRIARHTERLREVVGFYQDGIGLTEIGGFHDHEGDDGVFLAVPGTAAHLEFTAGGRHGPPAPHPESLLVPRRPRDGPDSGAAPRRRSAPPANPYWAEHGLTFQDPDGFRVVLVPERWENRDGGGRGA